MTRQRSDSDYRPELVALSYLIAAFLLLWSVFPSSASACLCSEVSIGAGMLYLGQGATLPRDAVGIPWSGPSVLEHSQVSLKRISNGEDEELEFSIKYVIIRAMQPRAIALIVPKERISPGQQYEIYIRESNWEQNQLIRKNHPDERLPAAEIRESIAVSDEAIVLHDITLQVTSTKRVINVYGGDSCWDWIFAHGVDIKVVFPPELEAHREYFLYETFVDGRAWTPKEHICSSVPPGRSWQPEAGTDMIYANCNRLKDGVEDGYHYVDVVVSIPGRDDKLIVRQVVFLDCEPIMEEVQEVDVTYSARSKEVQSSMSTPMSNDQAEGGYDSKPPPSGRPGCQVASHSDGSLLGVFMLLVCCTRRTRRHGHVVGVAQRQVVAHPR